MAQFDFYDLEGTLIIDVQSDLLSDLNTRVVVPLLPLSIAPTPAKRLNPVFTLGANQYALQPQMMGAIPFKELPAPLGSLATDHFVIKAALDMLIDGI